MNEPPFRPDPDATQPIPVTPIPVTPTRVAPPPIAPLPVATTAAPRFGNVGFYLLSRFLACAIDAFVIGFLVASFGFNAFERGFLLLAGRDEGGFAALAAISLGVAIAFAFLCEALFGTTLGKAIFGLRVRRRDGRHAGAPRILARYLLLPIDILVAGPLLALATPRHQRLGDFAGGTTVSYSRVAPLASVLGIAALAGIAYLEIAFGGGLESALGVAAETASYGPDLVVKSAAIVGVVVPGAPKIAIPFVAAQPSPSPRAVPSTAPVATASDAPSDDATDSPTDAPTDTATVEPTDAPSVEHI